MTLLSVAVGAFFSRLPDALKSSIRVDDLVGLTPALLVVFGLRSLKVGLEVAFFGGGGWFLGLGEWCRPLRHAS